MMVAQTVAWLVVSKVVCSVAVMAVRMVALLENLWVAKMVEM